jgi:hypothetical protein
VFDVLRGKHKGWKVLFDLFLRSSKTNPKFFKRTQMNLTELIFHLIVMWRKKFGEQACYVDKFKGYVHTSKQQTHKTRSS